MPIDQINTTYQSLTDPTRKAIKSQYQYE